MDIEKLSEIQMLTPINAVAIGTHQHILRGKTKGKDELFKLLVRWLGKVYVGIRIPIEGGKINLWSKFLVKSQLLMKKLQNK